METTDRISRQTGNIVAGISRTDSRPAVVDDAAVAQLRSAFERLITAPPYELSGDRFGALDQWPGAYQDYRVHLAWDVFKDAVALTISASPGGADTGIKPATSSSANTRMSSPTFSFSQSTRRRA